MYPLIRCFCGASIGDLYDLFLALRKEKYSEFFASDDFDPNLIPLCESENDANILDEMAITKKCCRMHFITGVEMKEYY